MVDSAPLLRSLRDTAATDARIPVGFVPANLPERVALSKVADELLDIRSGPDLVGKDPNLLIDRTFGRHRARRHYARRRPSAVPSVP